MPVRRRNVSPLACAESNESLTQHTAGIFAAIDVSDRSFHKVRAARAATGTHPIFMGPDSHAASAGCCSARAPAVLSLLTSLSACLRSEDAEADESIGRDTRLLESMPVASFTTAVTVLASTDLAYSCGDDDRITSLRLVYSDCDSAHATFVRTCVALFPVFVALCRLRICLVRVVWRRRARHATHMACASVFAFLSVSARFFLHYNAILAARAPKENYPPARG